MNSKASVGRRKVSQGSDLGIWMISRAAQTAGSQTRERVPYGDHGTLWFTGGWPDFKFLGFQAAAAAELIAAG